MARNQFYIIIIGLLLIILLSSVYQINITFIEIEKKIKEFINIIRYYQIKNFLEKYQNLIFLNNSEISYFKVYYNCSSDSISIENISKNCIILDKNLNYLPTSFDGYFLNFTFFDKIKYKKDICFFEGYVVCNDNFQSSIKINGTNPIYLEISNFITIDSNIFKNLIDLFLKDIIVNFYEGCIEFIYENPKISTRIISPIIKSLEFRNISFQNNIITISIKNSGNCPINIKKFFYETGNNIYKIIPGENVNSTSFIIYPGREEIFNFSNFNNFLCIIYFGDKVCYT